jgi:hypothetical protein
MSKKIDHALADLVKALRKHARVAGSGSVTLKKTQRATARVAATASAYAEAVHSKAGIDNPFSDVVSPGLQQATIASLAAERDHIASKHKTRNDPVRVTQAS